MPTDTRVQFRMGTMKDLSVQGQMARLRAWVIGRYRLRQRVGRSEELELIADPRIGISMGYGCGSIRLRPMYDRTWHGTMDLPAQNPMAHMGRVITVFDPWFEYNPHAPRKHTVEHTVEQGEFTTSTTGGYYR